MIATQVYQDLYKQVPEVAAEYAQVKVLWLHNSSAPGLMSRDKPIRSLEDFQKMLVRVPGPQAELVKALGATPVSMAVPDTYLAMDKGTVNAMIMPKEALVTFKLHEVTKSLTLGAETMFAPFCVAMNLQKWNSVPKDLQQIIDEESTKAAILNAKGWDRMDQEAVDLIKSQGKVIVQLLPEEVNRWREKAEGLRKEWIATRQDNKLPGKKVLDLTTDLFEKYGK
jgi:TRAP-type transport system periplasmic protein